MFNLTRAVLRWVVILENIRSNCRTFPPYKREHFHLGSLKRQRIERQNTSPKDKKSEKRLKELSTFVTIQRTSNFFIAGGWAEDPLFGGAGVVRFLV